MKIHVFCLSILYFWLFSTALAQEGITLPNDYYLNFKYPPSVSYYRNDTIFCCTIFLNPDSTILDSAIIDYCNVPTGRNRWISYYCNGDFQVSRFKKEKNPSYFYLKYNDTLFHAKYEMSCIEYVIYNAEGYKIFHRFNWFRTKKRLSFFAKEYSPPRKVKSKFIIKCSKGLPNSKIKDSN